MRLLTDERLSALVQAANAAPSADNRHPFRIAVDGDVLSLWPTAAFSEPPVHRRVLALLSTGAAVENLKLRGQRLGLSLSAHAAPPGAVTALLALPAAVERIDLSEGALESAIEQRHSNRSLRFRAPALGEKQRSDLAAVAEDVAGASVSWLDAPERRGRVLAMLRAAETARFRHQDLHRELFESIRFDVGWDAPAERGLPPGTLGLPQIERLGFGLLRRWPVQRLGNLLGLHHLIGFRAADLPCRWAPHVLVITTQKSRDRDALDAGRALQRVWLAAASRGVAVQLFAAPALYAHPASDPPPPLKRLLCEGWGALCSGRTPWVVLRLGHAPVPPVRTARPPPNELLR